MPSFLFPHISIPLTSYTPRNRFFRSRRKTSPALGSISVLKGVRPLFWCRNKGLRLNPLRQTSSISPLGSWLRSLYSLIFFICFFLLFFLPNKMGKMQRKNTFHVWSLVKMLGFVDCWSSNKAFSEVFFWDLKFVEDIVCYPQNSFVISSSFSFPNVDHPLRLGGHI